MWEESRNIQIIKEQRYVNKMKHDSTHQILNKHTHTNICLTARHTINEPTVHDKLCKYQTC